MQIKDLDTMDGSLSMQESADLMRIDRVTLYREAKRGTFPHYMVAGSMRVDPVRLADYIRSSSVPALRPPERVEPIIINERKRA